MKVSFKNFLLLILLVNLTIILLIEMNTQRKIINNGGLYGWPIEMINGENLLPYKLQDLPLISVIDSGIDLNNKYLNKNNIIQLVIDKESALSNQIHGTMVAGIIISQGNGRNTPGGLLPNARILSIQTGNDFGMKINQLALSIRLAVDKGARLINISYGTHEDSLELRLAVEYAISKKVVVVAAAGNENKYENDYPASYPGVIAVSALTKNIKLANESNYFESNISAPGDRLLTTAPENDNNSMQHFFGTSSATPIVTSVCALILKKHPEWDSRDVKSFLFSYSREVKYNNYKIKLLDIRNILNNL